MAPQDIQKHIYLALYHILAIEALEISEADFFASFAGNFCRVQSN